MSDCNLFSERTIGVDTIDDDALDAHAAGCPSCRRQLIAHRELRHAFQGLAQPSLSPHFDRELRRRLETERKRDRAHRWRLLLMQGYWMAASVACLCILWLTRWPAETPSALAVGALGMIFAMVLVTLVLLLRSLRTGFLDVIFGTMSLLRR
jgi:anti-sigma factor RsiW